MNNIPVTNVAGYVGSGLLKKLLLKGHHVTCVDNLIFGRKSLESNKFSWANKKTNLSN